MVLVWVSVDEMVASAAAAEVAVRPLCQVLDIAVENTGANSCELVAFAAVVDAACLPLRVVVAVCIAGEFLGQFFALHAVSEFVHHPAEADHASLPVEPAQRTRLSLL